MDFSYLGLYYQNFTRKGYWKEARGNQKKPTQVHVWHKEQIKEEIWTGWLTWPWRTSTYQISKKVEKRNCTSEGT